jgi:hypothetical protein
MNILLPIFVFVVWILWIPVCLLERAARRNPGGVSFLPVIPMFPLCAWGLAALLDWFHEQLGLIIVGSLHALLLLFFIISAARSLYVIRQHKRNVA